MNIYKDYDNVNCLVSGQLYSGEVLIVDFNINEGIEESKYYVVLNNGDIVEVIVK